MSASYVQAAYDSDRVDDASQLNKKLYFINEAVEWALTEYVWTGCTDVRLRDNVMIHASELIRQIIRKQGLHTIYPGQEESAFGDLMQTGWCLRPDSLLITRSGLQTMDTVVGTGGEHSDLEVYGLTGFEKVARSIRRPPTDTIKVGVKYGYNLEATHEHPILVLNSDGPKWVEAKSLKIGDHVAVQYGQMVFGNDDTIDFVPTTCGGTTKMWNPPAFFTEDLAYIIGLVIAEGSLEHGKTVIYNTEPEVITKLQNNTSGLDFRLEDDVIRNVTSTTRFAEFLTYLGLKPGVYSETKLIPERMLRCSKPIIAAMLRGMFDGDGHARKADGIVGYTTSSIVLRDQLRIVLANMGIISKTITVERGVGTFPGGKVSMRKTSYQLILTSIGSEIFYNEVGFNVVRKQINRRALTKKPFALIDVITANEFKKYIKSLNNQCLAKLGMDRHLLLYKKQFTVSTFLKVMYSTNCNDPYLCHRTAEYAGDDNGVKISWLPIVSLEASHCETIDIRVPTTENFTANSIIVHNCQLERTIYKYRARAHCRTCFNPDRPSDSILYEPDVREYGIKTAQDIVALYKRCPKCKTVLDTGPVVTPVQGRFGGTPTILFKGTSKVFNMWSQISRTVILAYIKKEGRDRKNSGSYVNHLGTRHRQMTDNIIRFFNELRQLWPYHDDYQTIISAMEWLVLNDEKPHDCMAIKLANKTNLSKHIVNNFLHLTKLRSAELSDSNLSRFTAEFRIDYRKSSADADADD